MVEERDRFVYYCSMAVYFLKLEEKNDWYVFRNGREIKYRFDICNTSRTEKIAGLILTFKESKKIIRVSTDDAVEVREYDFSREHRSVKGFVSFLRSFIKDIEKNFDVKKE